MVTQPAIAGTTSAADQPVALISTLASAFGPVHVAATDRGIVALSLAGPLERMVGDLERRLHGTIGAAAGAPRTDPRRVLLERTLAELDRWLDGEPMAFDDIPIDLADRPAWDRAVLAAVRATPWGTLTSYGAIARAVGKPGAGRAVGGAIGRNPVSVLVPCHRVIAADGTLGGYGVDPWGGREASLERKREMLALEGLAVARSRD